MNIYVLVRTLNEEHRIAQFCEAYKDATAVLVADGGSTDRTKEIAARYKNVIIRDYPGRMPLENGYWRNNDSDHVNFLIAWSKELEPGWVILDDCDSRPNELLRNNYRRIMEQTHASFIMPVRFYLWGTDKYFPSLSKFGVNNEIWGNFIWAWRSDIDQWAVDNPPAYFFRIGNDIVKGYPMNETLELNPPYCLLHYSWDDPLRVERKLKNYRESGFINMNHPLTSNGKLEALPDWAQENLVYNENSVSNP